jgi:nucleoside-diphosphate-sugar epimerase
MNNAYISYCSAKKEAEQAGWAFVEAEKPSFSVTVLLPALIFGPAIQPIKGGVKALNYSSSVLYGLINGSSETVPATTFPSYIDVRDLATAHVRALTEPKAANRRLLVGGMPMTYTDLVHSFAKVPKLKDRVPKDSGEDKKVVFPKLVAEPGNEILHLTFRPLDETIADAGRRLLELEKST